MIRKILDAIPESEIRKYLKEKDADEKPPLTNNAEITKAKRKAEKNRIEELARIMYLM